MDTQLSARFSLLKSKIDTLVAQRDDALRNLERSEAENGSLKKEIERLSQKLQQSDLDVEYLTVSHKLADSPQSLANARGIVQGLIKRVDKAIRLLSEDAGI